MRVAFLSLVLGSSVFSAFAAPFSTLEARTAHTLSPRLTSGGKKAEIAIGASGLVAAGAGTAVILAHARTQDKASAASKGTPLAPAPEVLPPPAPAAPPPPPFAPYTGPPASAPPSSPEAYSDYTAFSNAAPAPASAHAPAPAIFHADDTEATFAHFFTHERPGQLTAAYALLRHAEMARPATTWYRTGVESRLLKSGAELVNVALHEGRL